MATWRLSAPVLRAVLEDYENTSQTGVLQSESVGKETSGVLADNPLKMSCEGAKDDLKGGITMTGPGVLAAAAHLN